VLSAAIFIPILAAALLAFVPRTLAAGPTGERRMQVIATAVAAVPLVLLVVAWFRFAGTGTFEQVEAVEWIPTLGIGYRVGVDGLSLPLAAMTALVFVASIAYPVDLRSRPIPYFALMLFLEGVSIGLFLALDLFLFFVFWDVSLVAMYFLIGAWGHGDAQRSALKFFIYTFAGSLPLLLAILGLYLTTEPRTFDMAEIIRQQPLAAGGLYAILVFWGFFIGFAIKTPIVPVHTWLPPAHVDAPGPASALGYSSGILAHWFISSRAVFQDGMIARRQERTVQKALFVLSALAGLVLTTLIVTLADLAMIDAHLAKILAIIASFLLTYALRAQIVFKPGSFR